MKVSHASDVSADSRWKIGVVHSSYYKDEVSTLVEGAVKVLQKAGIKKENISLHPAPGCFEIPLIGSALASSKSVDALIGIGIIVEGETHHADLIAKEAARGIMDVQVNFAVPFAFEILYVKDLAQAKARLNKGEEAARAVLLSLAEIREIRS